MRDDGQEKFLDGKVIFYCGDFFDAMAKIYDESIDSSVTDPPYGLSFMGNDWDHGVPGVPFWREILRVLKPGAHLVAFGAPRNYHRMVCAIEDAGFEVRDSLMWIYGTGFPKSHDVSKGIDAKLLVGSARTEDMRKLAMGDDYEPSGRGRVNYDHGCGSNMSDAPAENDATPRTPEGLEWEGWGTALKPAFEPIVLARKPLSEGTVAANVLRWSTGALNIGACKVPSGGDKLGGGMVSMGRPKVSEGWDRPWMHDPEVTERKKSEAAAKVAAAESAGRWPANVVHDGSAEVVGAFPNAPGQQGALTGNEPSPTFSGSHIYGAMARTEASMPRGDSGSAARFFYSAKADADDRLGSKHPTVKPVALMRWLVRLVVPPGGVVLDPFAGTGTTAEAAFLEGMQSIVVERDPEYQGDIRRRMALVGAGPSERMVATAKAKLKGKPVDHGPLFGGGDAAPGT